MHFYQGKRALVTGGAGFIGSYVVEALLQKGAYVTVLDNLSTGAYENIQPHRNKIAFITGDITNLATCLSASREKDIVFHLAADVSVPASLEDPQHCYLTNVMGTANILEAARKNKINRVVFSSSSAVYGVQKGACSETAPCNPSSPYGHSKLLGEELCKQYAQTLGVGTVCLRYFNVYGDRQNPQGAYAAVVAKFKDAMQKNQPITLFGDGSQTRDFIKVENVAQANLQLGALPISELNGQVFNIGTGTSITINELFKRLKVEFPDYTHEPCYQAARAGDIQHSTADCTKFKSVAQPDF
ncbi:MAG: NAD-dependent epimerase/dehydratase family protein [Candidatus Babeliales bacterium]